MNKIFWVDLEMTGLDPEESVILEFAGIVTGLDLNPIARMQTVIYQDQAELAKMNDWNRTTHTESGLLAEVPSGRPLAEAEAMIINFVKQQFPDEKPILAGNSIHQDRKFIDKYMKNLSDHLHYRMIDVSSFKMVFKHLYQIEVKKSNLHRAYDDITASIDELKTYIEYIKIP